MSDMSFRVSLNGKFPYGKFQAHLSAIALHFNTVTLQHMSNLLGRTDYTVTVLPMEPKFVLLSLNQSSSVAVQY